MSFETTGIEKIKTKLADGPCLVAQLGTLLSTQEKPNTKLRMALEGMGIKTAIGRDKTEVYAFLPEDSQKMAHLQQSIQTESVYTIYRNAVLNAFFKEKNENTSIYVTLSPTFRYHEVNDGLTPPEGSILLDESFRIPKAESIENINAHDMQMFVKNLKEWCAKYNISIESTLWNPKKKFYEKGKADIITLLRDFINAQPEDIRSRVNLPCSIIKAILDQY